MVMMESACETVGTCNTDHRAFKALLARFMALTATMAPSTQPFIMPRLRATAIAAAKSCNGGKDKQTCGLVWTEGTYDGSPFGVALGGVGEHMAVMEVIQSNLVSQAKAPATQGKGEAHEENATIGSKNPKDGDTTRGSETGLCISCHGRVHI